MTPAPLSVPWGSRWATSKCPWGAGMFKCVSYSVLCPALIRFSLSSRTGPAASLSLALGPKGSRARIDLEDTTLGAGESRRHESSGTRNRPMPSKKSDDQKLADQANDLYWRSGQSVNQIAETMDLSKSGLYALVHPFPAERPCPDCGEELVFPNRTTKQKAIASCLHCEYVGEATRPGSEVRPSRPSRKRADRRRGRPVQADGGRPGTDLEPGPGGTAASKTGAGRRWKSNRVLWASVLLGVAAGLYVARRSR